MTGRETPGCDCDVPPRVDCPHSRPTAPHPCVGRSYLSAGRADVDEPMELIIECDGGPTGDCGWRVVVERQPYERPDGPWDIDITSDVFLPLHQQHLDHRAEKRHA